MIILLLLPSHTVPYRRKQHNEANAYVFCFVLLVFLSHTNVLLIDFWFLLCRFLRRIERAPVAVIAGVVFCLFESGSVESVFCHLKTDRAFLR